MQFNQIRFPVFILIASLYLVSCEHMPPNFQGDGSISFNLIVPKDLPRGDYYAISGFIGEQQLSQVEDSLIEVSIYRYYAQFREADGGSVPYDIFLNDNPLNRHRNGDTFRLGTTFDPTVTRDANTWKLMEGENVVTEFTIPTVDQLDTISPFQTLSSSLGTIRSDIDFRMEWKPAQTASTLRIEWESPNGDIVRNAEDFLGSYSIPAAVMRNLRGKGRVIITRLNSIVHEFEGKEIIATRVSQRVYDVTVQ